MRRRASPPSIRARRPRALAAGLLVAALAAGAEPLRAQPVLHEFIERFGQDDSVFAPPRSATAPPRPEGAAEPAPGSAPRGDGEAPAPSDATPPLGGDTFRIDSDTRKPTTASYTDPFTPQVAPFKRSFAYDAVDPDFELYVADKRLSPVPVARELTPTSEHFHAALALQVSAGEPLAIPSVGPEARVRMAHTDPSSRFRILQDSAGNWYFESERSGALELVLQIAADRRVFGAPLADPSFADLAPRLPPVPQGVKDSAREVAALLGIAQSLRPREVIDALVDHFRRFRPSEARFVGSGAALYRQLAVSRRGVCRHRAYAFVVTALGLGIPARFVMNEAHAWVEVNDGELWQRIDLGGAAENLELDRDGRPHHVQPRDPFAWPEGSDPGGEVVERSLRADAAEPAPLDPSAPPDSLDSVPAPALAPDPLPTPPSTPPAPSPSVTVSLTTRQSRSLRGEGVEVSGRVLVGARACRQAPVEIVLEASGGSRVPLGTLLSDDHGAFSGRLAIPWSLPVGDYRVKALSESAAKACGP